MLTVGHVARQHQEVGHVARKTQAVQWREARKQEALAHFERALVGLPDPRRLQGQRYPLRTVMVTALMAMVCGADDAQAMQTWSEANEDWLMEFLEVPHGVPTQDVYLAVFAAVEPEAFQTLFRAWTELLVVRLDDDGRQLALDGKTSRRSFDSGSGRKALHTVSAWLVEQGLVLGQISTEQKSNEITALPKLLGLLDLRGATVTIDAAGCQTKIADTIVKQDGEYLLAVKDNQPTLRSDVASSFADAMDDRPRPLDQPAPLAVEHCQKTSKGHGRIEVRDTYLCRDLSWMTTADNWCGLSYVAMAVSTRTDTATEETTTERRYFIGSEATASVEATARRIRNHWNIENGLHWVLDMAFDEDRARHRAGNAAANLATLRHLALNLLNNEPTAKLGVANKRKRAGWDRGYLLQVLTGSRS